MKIIDRYILKKFLGTFFYVILLMALISSVIDYSQKADDFILNKAPFGAIMNYFKNFIPHIISLLFPLFTFISVIFFTSRLAYRSEVIAILASGTSFRRFLRPYIIGAAFLGGLSLVANHLIVPAANKERLAFEDRYIHEAVSSSDKNVHLRLSRDLYVFVERYDYIGNMGYGFVAERLNNGSLQQRLTAQRASYDSLTKEWTLYNVNIRNIDGLHESLENEVQMKTKYAFTPKDLKANDEIMMAMTTPQLNQVIEKEKMRGRENLNFYYVEKYRRTAQPTACFILTMIGACIASRKVRGGSGFHLVMGISFSAIYMMMLQFSTTFSTKAGFNPFLAVWSPNILFGIAAVYLYRRQIR